MNKHTSDFEKIPTTESTLSTEKIEDNKNKYTETTYQKSISKTWLETDQLDTKIAKEAKKLTAENQKTKSTNSSNWYSHDEQHAIKPTESENIYTVEKDGIMYQMSGKPLTPENGTDTYVYGHYDKNKHTVAFVNGMGEPGEFAHLIDKEQLNGNNIVMLAIDHSKPLHDNIQKIIQSLQKFRDQGIKIDEIIAHSMGNRFTLGMLQELGIQNNDLLIGVNVIGLNPKLADDNVAGHSTGIAGTFTKLAGDITGGGYDNITTMMDAENSTNKYLNGNLTTIKKALGNGTMSFIVANNDPHNPNNTTAAGALFNNILKKANTVKYINPPTNPHKWLLEN
jgi:hypothetical protein